MSNKSLFASMLGRLPKANSVNEAGGRAYKLEPKHALAQVPLRVRSVTRSTARLRRSSTKSCSRSMKSTTTSTWPSWRCTLVRRRS